MEVPPATPAGDLPTEIGYSITLIRMSWHAQGLIYALVLAYHAPSPCRLGGAQQQELHRSRPCGRSPSLRALDRSRPSAGWISAAGEPSCSHGRAAERRAQPLPRPCAGGRSLGGAGRPGGGYSPSWVV